MKCGRPRGEIDELAEARALAWNQAVLRNLAAERIVELEATIVEALVPFGFTSMPVESHDVTLTDAQAAGLRRLRALVRTSS
jgi:hypothetical protein